MPGKYKHNKTWRKRNPKIWREQRRRYYAQFVAEATNASEVWTDAENAAITDPARLIDRILARQLGRNINAIQTQRCKLKKGIARNTQRPRRAI